MPGPPLATAGGQPDGEESPERRTEKMRESRLVVGKPATAAGLATTTFGIVAVVVVVVGGVEGGGGVSLSEVGVRSRSEEERR